MNSLGALLFVVSVRVIICQHEREPAGHRAREGPPMSNVNEEALALGTLSAEGTSMAESKKVYLPLRSEYHGVLHKVEAFFMSTEPLYVQIWQPLSPFVYQLITQFVVQSETANVTKTVTTALRRNYMCPLVREGDRLGLFSLGQKTPIAVTEAADGRIPITTRTTVINNDEKLNFQNVEFHNRFSVKFFIHKVSPQRAYQNGGQQRYAPCPREDSETGSMSREALSVVSKQWGRTAGRTRPPLTTTTTTTTKTTTTTAKRTTTAPNVKEMTNAVGVVSRMSFAMGRTTSNGPDNRHPGVTSTKGPTRGTTSSSSTEQPAGHVQASGHPTVARVPVVTATGEDRRVLGSTEKTDNKNVLIIAVAVLAGVALIAITVAVVVATRRHCAQSPSKQHQSAAIRIDVPTPTSKNPAYGISCDFLNPYSTPTGCRDDDETSSHEYRPVIPTRPHAVSRARPVAIYDDISRDSPRRSRNSGRATPFSTPANHIYLDLVSDDVDSGVGDSENGGSRPSSGATDSSS